MNWRASLSVPNSRGHLCLALLAVLLGEGVTAQPVQGHLVIIGGGRRGPEIMTTFVHLAGDARSRIVVFPMASSLADSMESEQIAFLKKNGANEVLYLNITREQAERDSIVRLLDGATGVFFSGGKQSKLTAALRGTRVEARLHELYRDGAVLGGTSAGAAVMSRMMITGDDRSPRDSAESFSAIREKSVVTAEGFGFLDGAIVDQHFIKRKRHNRLLTLVLEHPGLLGIGIDEATAIVVKPDHTFDVVGDATVVVFDASGTPGVSVDAKGNLAGSNIRMHILKSGDRFDLTERKSLEQ